MDEREADLGTTSSGAPGTTAGGETPDTHPILGLPDEALIGAVAVPPEARQEVLSGAAFTPKHAAIINGLFAEEELDVLADMLAN